MATKVKGMGRICAVFVMSAVLGFPVFSQEKDVPEEDFTALAAEEKNTGREFYSYIREEENGERRFIQYLSWQGGKYVRYYEVIIERKEGTAYREVLRRTTQETFIEFSFGGGFYRYRVEAYDLLNRPSGNAPWKDFTIIAVLPPEISGFSPGELNRNEKGPYQITITGSNFSSHGQVFLRNQKNGKALEASLVQVDSSGQTIKMIFTEKQLVSGSYDICIINPGEFETSAGTLAIKTQAADFSVSAGYAPLVPLYGNLFDLFDAFDFLGAYARVGFVPFETDFGSFGFELNPFWDYLTISQNDYGGTSHLAGVHINALYQKSLPIKNMFINARLGGGVTSLLDFHFTYPNGVSRSMNGLYLSAGAELSFQWFFFRSCYLEAGLAYRHIAGEPFQQGYISPFAGAGIRF
jgi:hypothetical protein